VAYAGGSKGTRLGESAVATLPLLAYLALATTLMVADHRVALGGMLRQQFAILAEPVWWLASLPSTLGRELGEGMALREQLQAENSRLRERVQVDAARIGRLQAQALENQRLRALLDGAERHRLDVHLAELIDVDLDPYRQRVLLGQGKAQGVKVGQAVMDAGGLLGQVIEASANRATVLLLTDPDHAVPVQAARSGFRGIAYGGVGLVGRPSSLQVPNVPQSADLRNGDVLVTSGLGGRFPPGLPVGVVGELHPDATGLFIVAEVRPAAQLDRGTHVLLLDEVVERIEAVSPGAATPAAAAATTPGVPAIPKAAEGKASSATPGQPGAEAAKPPAKPVVEGKPADGSGQEPRP
jgi:rod shape-determining protein MreC